VSVLKPLRGVDPGLADMTAHLLRPGVGLVTSPIRARPNGSFGAALESLQLNGFVMGRVAALSLYVGKPCVVGKSMMLRRAHLERLGGFAFLGRFLAEDQVCGEEIARLGLRIAVSAAPVDNVLAPLSLRDFASRHLRWARIRRRVCPANPHRAARRLHPSRGVDGERPRHEVVGGPGYGRAASGLRSGCDGGRSHHSGSAIDARHH
jgi:hypothetical protein